LNNETMTLSAEEQAEQTFGRKLGETFMRLHESQQCELQEKLAQIDLETAFDDPLDDGGGTFGFGAEIWGAVHPDQYEANGLDRGLIEEFGERYLDDKYPSADRAYGFVLGSLEFDGSET
jgi:hypothetical protein